MNPMNQRLQNRTNPINQMQSLRQMMAGKNPDAVFNELMRTNPNFRSFVESNKGKTPEQIAREHGIDLNSILKR